MESLYGTAIVHTAWLVFAIAPKKLSNMGLKVLGNHATNAQLKYNNPSIRLFLIHNLYFSTIDVRKVSTSYLALLGIFFSSSCFGIIIPDFPCIFFLNTTL